MRRLLIVLSVTAIVAAACSSDDGTASTPSPEPTATDAATTSTQAATTTTEPATTTTEPATTTTVASRDLTVDELLSLGRPIVLAHTAGEDEFPGSTMYGFGESMKANVDMLDLNVMLTKDGVLIVQHDDSVDRLTNSTGKIADMTFDEVHTLDNAYWFSDGCVCRELDEAAYVWRGVRTGAKPPPEGYTADDFAVPTLRELIETYPDIPLNIEIEGDGQAGAAAAKALADLLVELDRTEASVVASFDDATVSVFHALLPDVEISPGIGASSAWILNGTPLPDGMRILQLPPMFQDIEVLSPANVQKSHDAGYLIWVWPNDHYLENEAAYADFLQQGMDGLNINYPAAGVAALTAFTAE